MPNCFHIKHILVKKVNNTQRQF